MYTWPERYPDVVKGRYAISHGISFDHIDHCINALRESVMCSADISPNVWQRPPGYNTSIVHFNTVHTCRNFDALQDWADLRVPKGEEIRYIWPPNVTDADMYVEHKHEHPHGPVG